jgi:hypothetical protein
MFFLKNQHEQLFLFHATFCLINNIECTMLIENSPWRVWGKRGILDHPRQFHIDYKISVVHANYFPRHHTKRIGLCSVAIVIGERPRWCRHYVWRAHKKHLGLSIYHGLFLCTRHVIKGQMQTTYVGGQSHFWDNIPGFLVLLPK